MAIHPVKDLMDKGRKIKLRTPLYEVKANFLITIKTFPISPKTNLLLWGIAQKCKM